MIEENSDPAALIAQADIHRFYEKVIEPALKEFEPGDDIPSMETTDMDEFFEAARVATHNTLCHEMRRAFALTLEALFERQLRSWLLAKRPVAEHKEIESIANLATLLERVDKVDNSVRLKGPEKDLEVLRLVANAVRHGNGRSADELQKAVPKFWDHIPKQSNLRWQADLVGNMRIADGDLKRYVLAILSFWHLAGASSIPGVLSR